MNYGRIERKNVSRLGNMTTAHTFSKKGPLMSVGTTYSGHKLNYSNASATT